MEFQLPRQWAPIFGDLPLGPQRRHSNFASLQFSLLGPRLYVNTTPVSSLNFNTSVWNYILFVLLTQQHQLKIILSSSWSYMRLTLHTTLHTKGKSYFLFGALVFHILFDTAFFPVLRLTQCNVISQLRVLLSTLSISSLSPHLTLVAIISIPQELFKYAPSKLSIRSYILLKVYPISHYQQYSQQI